MSNIDKQALREEFRLMQAHYSDPADRARQVIYIAAEALLDELEAARQRIAELEARTVNLSKLSVGEVMHLSGFSRDYAEGWCAGNDNAIHEIRTAGIKVKES
ncbi:ead/Ea22-like family protein [Salmonella enterica]|nr:ead/Ea22-like family protein [Salmonella enterica]ECQ7776437.1 ead/Ea22-like family protein [Salmonella enterica]